MKILNDEQIALSMLHLHEYLNAPANPDGRTPIQVQTIRDQSRVKTIADQLAPLLSDYLSGKIGIDEFKTRNDGINKRDRYWGFAGIKGQMFFNMVFNTARDLEKLNRELRLAMQLPRDEMEANEKLNNFANYVTWLGEEWQAAGESKSGRPKVGSVPFFVSYFWQIQDSKVWPVYYTNSVNVMEKFNLWQPTGDVGRNYIEFKHIHEQLADAFTQKTGQKFGLYEVEHVFWFKGGNPYGENLPLQIAKDDRTNAEEKVVIKPPTLPIAEIKLQTLPDSYVPPVISILPEMARGGEAIRKAASGSGISLEKAFEKYINAAFTIMGYETILLGQGRGRVPDGQALNANDSYALLWDAKVRGEGYQLGTDDRTIKEYVTNASRDLDRGRRLRNLYYLVISSEFAGDYDDSIRMLKMETDVSEVCLVEADALVEMVDARLRSPLDVTLGPDGLQRLFAVSGIVTRNHVRESLE